ncbi:MAG TPA: hypothetical protein VJB11_03575 [archaeon]|nr:hypothetical protein [archaeon]
MARKQNNANIMTVLAVIAAIAVVAVVAYAIGQNSYQQNYGMMQSYGRANMMGSGMMSGNMMQGMMGSGMMNGRNSMMNSGMHGADDIEWMRNEMKEYMNLSDEQINNMIESCPMMKGI